MDAIKVLRQRAADKRDASIKAARNEFNRATRLLDDLQTYLGKPDKPKRRRGGPEPMLALIVRIMPRDKPFTLDELLAVLRNDNPNRDFHTPSVRVLMRDLVNSGHLRKVRRAASGIVYWAAPECLSNDSPIASMSIGDAAAMVLEERGPLSSAEIVVTLKTLGYRPDDDPRVLLRTLQYAFKRNRARFERRDDGKWSVKV